MDLMQRRRELLMMGGGGYIKNGLIFQLDGINKGTTDTTKWVDLVGGITFTEAGGTSVHSTDNITLTTTQRMVGDVMLDAPYTTHTIEGVIDVGDYNWIFIFATKRDNLSLYINSSKRFANSSASSALETTTLYTGGKLAISAAHSNFIVNGQQVGTQSFNFQNIRNTLPVINSMQQGAQSYAKNITIYALRIYNRLLTTDEMLNNQRIDNERFNLGLTL